MRPPVDVGVHRAPRCEPVVSLVRSKESPTCPPDRSSKILLVQVGTLSSSHPSFGVSVFFLSFSLCLYRCWRVQTTPAIHINIQPREIAHRQSRNTGWSQGRRAKTLSRALDADSEAAPVRRLVPVRASPVPSVVRGSFVVKFFLSLDRSADASMSSLSICGSVSRPRTKDF